MKRLFRHFIIDTYSLWIISQIARGMFFDRGIITLIIAGAAVSLVSLLAKPVINILLLPINLVTFGVFRWVSSAVVIYLVSLLITDFKVEYFNYSGLSNAWIDIPSFNFTGILAYISFSFLLSIFSSFVYWLIK